MVFQALCGTSFQSVKTPDDALYGGPSYEDTHGAQTMPCAAALEGAGEEGYRCEEGSA